MQVREVQLWTAYVLMAVTSILLNLMSLFAEFSKSVQTLLIVFGSLLVLPMMLITWKMSSVHRTQP